MANPQLPIGVQTSIPPTGTNPPTSLAYPSFVTTHGGWEIANPAGTVIAWFARYGSADSTGGWYGAADFPNAQIGGTGPPHTTAFPLTPPAGTPVAAGYEIRTFTPTGPAASAFFNVIAVASPTAAPRIRPRVIVF